MRFSKFCKIYECCTENNDFYYLLRHSLLNYMYLLPEKEFKILLDNLNEKNLSKDFNELNKNHLIVNDKYSEKKLLSYVLKDKKSTTPYFTIFYLIFNTKCNLKCKYCYVDGSIEQDFKYQEMDLKVLNQSFLFLDNFIYNGKKEGKIGKKLIFIFYGSEPLMFPKLFRASLSKIEKISKKYKLPIEKEIITNGTLITPSLSKLFKEKEVSVSVSLDGKKNVNDIMRKFPNGKGSFKKIFEGIKYLKDNNVPFSISCTLGSHNLKKLKENIEFFKKIGARGIGFNLLLDARFKNIEFPSLYDTNQKLLESFYIAKKNGFYESRIAKKLKPFNSPGSVHIKDCGAYGNQLIFFPNGDLGICQASLGCRKNILGNVFSSNFSEVINSPIFKNWLKRTPLNYNKCLRCPAIGICGGGCALSSEIIYNDIHTRNKKFCMHTFMTLNWLIEETLKKKLNSKKVFYNDITFMFQKDF